MFRLIKKILLILFFLIVLIGSLIAIFILTFDLNRYKDFTEKKLSAALHRPVTIESMTTKLSLVPTIKINGLKILNTEPFQEKEPLLYVQHMDAELELAPLLNSNINIHKIIIDEASINLYKEGTNNNWVSKIQEEKEEQKKKALTKKLTTDNFHLNLISVNNLNISYNEADQTETLQLKKLSLKNFHILSGEVIQKNQTFSFNLKAGTIFDFLNQTPNFPIDLKITSRILNLSINGKIGDFNNLSGLQATVTMDTINLKNACNFFNIKNQKIPAQSAKAKIQAIGDIKKLTLKQGNFSINAGKDMQITALGTIENIKTNPSATLDINFQLLKGKTSDLWKIQPMNITGDLHLSQDHIKSKLLTVDANRSDIRVTFDATKTEGKYNISTALASNFLNIYDIFQKNQTQTTKETKKTTSTTKNKEVVLPWDLLKKFNVNLNLNIKHLQTLDVIDEYIGISTRSTLYDEVLTVPFKIEALNGSIQGTLNANAIKQNISFSARGTHLNLDNISPIQNEIKNMVIDSQISATTQGATLNKALNNLNAQIVAETHQGTILNKWFSNLPKLLNLTKNNATTFNATEVRTSIECAAINIKIKNGIIQGDNQLALMTNNINLLAGGTINLNDKTMDITVHPSLSEKSKTNNWLDFTKFIRISGPFTNLTPKVDTQKIAQNLIEKGMEKIIPQQNTQLSLCQMVLGKDELIKKEPKPTQQQTKPAAQPQPTQDKTQEFKQQLMDSLFKALAQ